MPDTTQAITQMFSELSGGYDRFNRFASLGLDGIWRGAVLDDVKLGMAVLDLGTGTGDLAFGALERVGPGGSVTGLDASPQMLELARRRAARVKDGSSIHWVNKLAEDLPLGSDRFDLIISGFVLRNLRPNFDSILKGIRESLQPGGTISFVDLTEPDNPVLQRLASLYFASAVLLWGKLFFKSEKPIQYLRNSMRNFFRARQFVEVLEKAGFKEIRVKRFLFGMVTHYRARI